MDHLRLLFLYTAELSSCVRDGITQNTYYIYSLAFYQMFANYCPSKTKLWFSHRTSQHLCLPIFAHAIPSP